MTNDSESRDVTILIMLMVVTSISLLCGYFIRDRSDLEHKMISHWDSRHRILSIKPTDKYMTLCINSECHSIEFWLSNDR